MYKSALASQLQSSLTSQRQQAYNGNFKVDAAALTERKTLKRKRRGDSRPERATKRMRKFLISNQTPVYKEERGTTEKTRPEDEREGARTRAKTTESPSQHFILISSGSEESKTANTRTAKPEDDQEGARTRTRRTESPSQHYILISSGSESKSGTKRKASCAARQEGSSSRARKSQRSSRHCIVTSVNRPSPAASAPSTFQGHKSYRETFEAKYMEVESLGSGGFGAVFAGYRREDTKPVAIKHIDQRIVARISVPVNGQVHYFPLEALLMNMAVDEGETSGNGATIALLEYFELDDEVILVMEHPAPCMDLCGYITSFGHLQESQAKNIQKQLVDAAIHIHSKGIFHRDLKPENILVQLNSDDPCVKVIDFGCGALLREQHSGRAGTPLYNPPEMNHDCIYKPEPATVWQLAAVLYTMLHGCLPFNSKDEIINKKPTLCNTLSANCCEFLVRCLAKNSEDRPTLEELQRHPWLQGCRVGTLAQ